MAKWSTPGIVFREIDNSIRNNTETTLGVGAIVLKANKGYVNQRILSTSRQQFHNTFGDQESDTDYGHFAADQYLAVSRDLLAIRATMGDEGYSFIQYPYTDAIEFESDPELQRLKYVDNEGTNKIQLVKQFDSNAASFYDLYLQGWTASSTDGENIGTASKPVTTATTFSGYALYSKGNQYFIEDVLKENDPTIYVLRENTAFSEANPVQQGYYYKINTQKPGAPKYVSMALKAPLDQIKYLDASKGYSLGQSPVAAYTSTSDSWEVKDNGDSIITSQNGYKITVHIPAVSSLDNNELNFSFYSSGTDVKNYTVANWANVAISGMNNYNAKALAASSKCARLDLQDWSDLETKTFYVKINDTAKVLYTDENGNEQTTGEQTIGIQFREYGFSDYSERLVLKYQTAKTTGLTQQQKVELAAEYGIDDVSEILNDKFNVLYFVDATTDSAVGLAGNKWYNDETNPSIQRALIYVDKTKSAEYKNGVKESKVLFTTYYDTDTKKMKIVASYVTDGATEICIPYQIDKHADKVQKMNAFPTSEVLADTTGRYKDGYTPSIDTDDEPGNGDIERYASNQKDVLVIGAVSPGEWGNDIGVSIITPEAADFKALDGNQNALSWKYLFDDENDVNEDVKPDLTWKKVYKINVYQKLKSQNASTWGSGLDALVSDPIESYLVSNDPNVKDGNGDSMYAPNVINGRSQFIYVSRKSVNGARTLDGEYAMPKMTFNIYPLTGGSNSTLNNIKEKTAALKLFSDRQKANFDFIFNVEPIDTFQSKQKYAAHQRRIAEIACDRGLDLGIIQTTSKAAKTARQGLSEAKMFNFANGSYVASYAGYDKYRDSYTGNWVYLPKSVAGACACAYCALYAKPWDAPAMQPRGQISYSEGQLMKLSDLEIGQFYDNHINVSRTCAGYGELLWGQKTMLKKDSALNRINVRCLLNNIEKNLETMLLPFLYANNTPAVRANMKNTVDSFLSRIMSEGGLLAKDVSIETDPSDPHIVYVNLSIIPAETIEWICVTTTVNRNSGVSSTEST